jgi:hypothetical protein
VTGEAEWTSAVVPVKGIAVAVREQLIEADFPGGIICGQHGIIYRPPAGGKDVNFSAAAAFAQGFKAFGGGTAVTDNSDVVSALLQLSVSLLVVGVGGSLQYIFSGLYRKILRCRFSRFSKNTIVHPFTSLATGGNYRLT